MRARVCVRVRVRVRARVVLAHRAAYDGVGQLDARIGASEAGGGERARARDGQRGAEIEHRVHLRPCVSEAATLRVGSRNPTHCQGCSPIRQRPTLPRWSRASWKRAAPPRRAAPQPPPRAPRE